MDPGVGFVGREAVGYHETPAHGEQPAQPQADLEFGGGNLVRVGGQDLLRRPVRGVGERGEVPAERSPPGVLEVDPHQTVRGGQDVAEVRIAVQRAHRQPGDGVAEPPRVGAQRGQFGLGDRAVPGKHVERVPDVAERSVDRQFAGIPAERQMQLRQRLRHLVDREPALRVVRQVPPEREHQVAVVVRPGRRVGARLDHRQAAGVQVPGQVDVPGQPGGHARPYQRARGGHPGHHRRRAQVDQHVAPVGKDLGVAGPDAEPAGDLDGRGDRVFRGVHEDLACVGDALVSMDRRWIRCRPRSCAIRGRDARHVATGEMRRRTPACDARHRQ
jgi:hypothetical protein